MQLACKIKKEAERIKTISGALTNIYTPQNFIVEFETLDGVVIERIENDKYKAILREIIELFFGNRLFALISGMYPDGLFPCVINNSKYEPPIGIKTFNIHFTVSHVFLPLESFNNYDLFGQEPFPNFRLEYDEFSIDLETLLFLINNLRKKYKEKKVESIYHDVLDIAVDILSKEKKIYNKEASSINVEFCCSPIKKMLYSLYSFRLVFYEPSNALKLVFIRLGREYHFAQNEVILYFYDYNHDSKKYKTMNVCENIISYISETRSLEEKEKERIRYVTMGIFGNLLEMITERAIKEKRLNKFLLDIFLPTLEAIIKERKSHYNNHALHQSIIILPKRKNDLLLTRKYKIIGNILRNVIKEIKKRKTELIEKWSLFASYLFLKNKNGFVVSLYLYDSGDMRLMISYLEPLKYQEYMGKKAMNIDISPALSKYGEEIYKIYFSVYPDFYYIINELKIREELYVEKLFSDPSLELLLEIAGMGKRELEFLLKAIEVELSPTIEFDKKLYK